MTDQYEVHSIPFVIDETPYCLWDCDPAKINLEFLERIDPDYFSHVANTFAPLLDGDTKHYAATSLRMAYSHGMEALFALLCAFAQAPQCPAGWLLKYMNKELENVVRKIHHGEPLLHRFDMVPQMTWRAIADIIFGYATDDPARDIDRRAAFAQLWTRLAEEYLCLDFTEEYNSMKHGFRAGMGGTTVAFGKHPDAMHIVASSVFGSHFSVPSPLQNKTNFCLVEKQRNWHPGKFVVELQLISMSIVNVVNALKCYSGKPFVELTRFPEPGDFAHFGLSEQYESDTAIFKIDPGYNPDDFKDTAMTKKAILASYSQAAPCHPSE